METEKIPQIPNKLNCILCNYITVSKKDFKKHLLTSKHIQRAKTSNFSTLGDNKNPNKCKKCNKEYKSRNGLWKHQNKCEQTEVPTNINLIIDKEIVMEILKQNDELKKILVEQNQHFIEQSNKMFELCKNGINNTTNTNCNNNNKTFNLQLFLNEQCKDAMNITDFIKSLDLQMEDLESLGELGYVEGMTNMIAKRLRDIDIYKRPIHCSDAKREIIHIKHEDKWHKEEPGNPIFRSAVKMVVGGNFRLLAQWTALHPESSQYHSRWNDVYNKLVKEASGGNGDYESNNNTIMKRLTKLVVIEK